MDDSHPPTVNSTCVIIVPCPIGLGSDLMDAVIKRFRWSRNRTVASPLYFIKLFREELIATTLNYALNGHGNFVFWPISWPLGHLNISILFLSPYFSVKSIFTTKSLKLCWQYRKMSKKKYLRICTIHPSIDFSSPSHKCRDLSTALEMTRLSSDTFKQKLWLIL